MNKVDERYKELVKEILENGVDKDDRTGVGTRSIFGYQMEIPISYKEFPILTLKHVVFKSMVHELLWFISGETSIDYLKNNDVGIWDKWADSNNEVGPVYGYQWRSWPKLNGESVDQLQRVIDNINENPDSRRHLVTAWNAGQVEDMALPPCHHSFQFYSKPLTFEERCEVFFDWHAGTHIAQQPLTKETLENYQVPKRELSCKVTFRSNDTFIGLPFNISSYSLLTLIVCELTEHSPGKLVYSIGDAHIYQNHYNQCVEILNNKSYSLPEMKVSDEPKDIDEYKFDDFELSGYKSNEFVKAPVAK